MNLPYFLKFIFSVISLAVCWVSSLSQTDNNLLAIKKLVQVSQAYKSASRLSFNVKYQYSSEQLPELVLDSLQGKFKIDGNHYWYSLDSTEALCDGVQVIVLYKEDKVMYLTDATKGSVAMNQILSVDSLTSMANVVKYSISENAGHFIISMDFPPGKSYKRMEYLVDAKTSYIKEIIQVVDDQLLYNNSFRAGPEMDIKYSIIKTIFSQYQSGGYQQDFFDIGRYYKKIGSNYLASYPYEGYTVFLGSTNF